MIRLLYPHNGPVSQKHSYTLCTSTNVSHACIHPSSGFFHVADEYLSEEDTGVTVNFENLHIGFENPL